MTQNINQFSQAPVQGQLDLRFNTNTVTCQVDTSQATAMVPGQAVKLVDSAGGVPKVIAATDDADDVYGFINYDIKDREFVAFDAVEVSVMHDNVMYMTADAAIARGAEVAVVIADVEVRTAVATDRIVGRAYDKATAAGQLIRVTINLPGAIKS
jgi:hypothetical protein